MAQKPKSSNKRESNHPGCMVLFFGVFLVFGLIFLWFIFLEPVLSILDARNWEPVEATVISSDVGVHPSDEGGSTYSVDITYGYAWGGGEFTSDRYQFMTGSSSGYDGKAAVVEAHPPGSKITCYVDPTAPAEAVIHRGLHWELLFGLLPMIFVAVGAGGIVWSISTWRNRGGPANVETSSWRPKPSLAEQVRTAQEARPGIAGLVGGPPPGAAGHSFLASAAGTDAPIPVGSSGAQELEADSSPLGQLIIMILISLFWNGIVSIFVYQAYKSWTSGSADWFLTLFLIPFVLVGLALIGGIVHTFLALFNPRLSLHISSGQARPGEMIQVSWTFNRPPNRVRRFKIVLEGREEATYRRGTSTHTAKEVFAEIPVVDQTPRRNEMTGSASLQLPPHLMHSFEANRNKIVWKLKAVGDIPNWPDITHEYPFIVQPAAVTGGFR